MLTVVWPCHIISMLRPALEFITMASLWLLLLARSILSNVSPSLSKAQVFLAWLNIAYPNFGKALVFVVPGNNQGFVRECEHSPYRNLTLAYLNLIHLWMRY